MFWYRYNGAYNIVDIGDACDCFVWVVSRLFRFLYNDAYTRRDPHEFDGFICFSFDVTYFMYNLILGVR
jgi:hypothetical protein